MMKAAYFIIDMQISQGERIGFADWMSLVRTVCGLREAVEPYGVPTVHFASVSPYLSPTSTRRGSLEVGTFAEIRSLLLKEQGFDLNYEFGIPVPPQALVAGKTTYSGCTPSVRRWIDKEGIDTVILAGIWESLTPRPKKNVHSCVTATAMDLAAAGIETIIASEATNVAHDARQRDPRPPGQRAKDAKAYGVTIMPLRECVQMAQAQLQPMQACAGLR